MVHLPVRRVGSELCLRRSGRGRELCADTRSRRAAWATLNPAYSDPRSGRFTARRSTAGGAARKASCRGETRPAQAQNGWRTTRTRLRATDSTVTSTTPAEIARSSLAEVGRPRLTIVLLDLWGHNHDAQLWGDPYAFWPERFLDHRSARSNSCGKARATGRRPTAVPASRSPWPC